MSANTMQNVTPVNASGSAVVVDSKPPSEEFCLIARLSWRLFERVFRGLFIAIKTAVYVYGMIFYTTIGQALEHACSPKFWLPYIGIAFSIMYVMHSSYGWVPSGWHFIFSQGMTVYFTAIGLLVFSVTMAFDCMGRMAKRIGQKAYDDIREMYKPDAEFYEHVLQSKLQVWMKVAQYKKNIYLAPEADISCDRCIKAAAMYMGEFGQGFRAKGEIDETHAAKCSEHVFDIPNVAAIIACLAVASPMTTLEGPSGNANKHKNRMDRSNAGKRNLHRAKMIADDTYRALLNLDDNENNKYLDWVNSEMNDAMMDQRGARYTYEEGMTVQDFIRYNNLPLSVANMNDRSRVKYEAAPVMPFVGFEEVQLTLPDTEKKWEEYVQEVTQHTLTALKKALAEDRYETLVELEAKTEPALLLPAASSSTTVANAEQTTAVPLSNRQKRKQKFDKKVENRARQLAGLPAVSNEDKRPVAEGNVCGSTKQKGEFLAAVLLDGLQMNGFLKSQAGITYFVGPDHGPVDGDVSQVYSGKEVDAILVRQYKADKKIRMAIHCFGPRDRVVWKIHTGMETFRQPRFEMPRLGMIVNVTAFSADAGWQTSFGKIEAIAEGGDICNYSLSTTEGDCRAVVLSQTGCIVAGHFASRLSIEGKSFPAGWVENGELIGTGHNLNPFSPSTWQGVGDCFNGGRVEARKVYGPTSRVWKSVARQHIMMKPSTAMLKKEVARFQEETNFSGNACMKALEVLLYEEEHLACPWDKPDTDTAMNRIRHLLSGGSNAGVDGFVDGRPCYQTQKDYIVSLGDGSEEAGLRELVRRCEKFVDFCADKVELDTELLDFLYSCTNWTVQGKMDGYKPKKMDTGRSIQAASTSFKALWRYVFADSDERWNKNGWYFRTGRNLDLPVPFERAQTYMQSEHCIAFDATAWDRYMPAPLIETFFRYLDSQNPGIPKKLLGWMFKMTAECTMWFTDGTSTKKTRGNPSGHPATLRLNCVVNFLVWGQYFCDQIGAQRFKEKLEDRTIFPEFMGDDSRVWGTGQEAADLLDEQRVLAYMNKHFPWQMKVEGTWKRDHSKHITEDILHAPPFASRSLVYIDGFVWQIMANPCRAARKMLSDMKRSADEDIELANAINAVMANLDAWELRKKIKCPAVAELRETPGWSTQHSKAIQAGAYRVGLIEGCGLSL